jgi:phytanoyl-CoA hydroxylase
MPHRLTDVEIGHYRKEGFVVVPVFNRADLDRIDQCIDEISTQALASGNYDKVLEMEPAAAGKPVVRRIYNPFEQHETFRSLATDDRLLDRVECLVGSSIQIQHSKLNMKAAHFGSPVEWHQDLSYFPHTNTDLVTVLVYLDNATKLNGCLQVIPKLHDRYLRHHTSDGMFAGMITEEISQYGEPVSLEAPAGSVIFMHCLTPHSSLPNRSSQPRRTLIFEYRAADAYPIYHSTQLVEGEKLTRQVRGERSRYARFGGPPAAIPFMPQEFINLYQIQEKTKAKLGVSG